MRLPLHAPRASTEFFVFTLCRPMAGHDSLACATLRDAVFNFSPLFAPSNPHWDPLRAACPVVAFLVSATGLRLLAAPLGNAPPLALWCSMIHWRWGVYRKKKRAPKGAARTTQKKGHPQKPRSLCRKIKKKIKKRERQKINHAPATSELSHPCCLDEAHRRIGGTVVASRAFAPFHCAAKKGVAKHGIRKKEKNKRTQEKKRD
nr:hypothetical protein [Pandoravirus massiliensis]